MTISVAAARLAWLALITLIAFTAPLATAETLVQSNFDTRTLVTFEAAPAAVEKWLTPPWRVAPVASGPAKGTNIFLVFIDRVGNYGADGKAAAIGGERSLVVVVPAKHPQTGETAPYVSKIYTGNPQTVPGPYKNSVLGQIRYEHSMKSTNAEPAVLSEMWEVRDPNGGMVQLTLQYPRGPVARSNVDQKVRGGPDPDFFRIYRVDQAADLIKSVPMQVDRAQKYELKITMSDLRPTFDGTEKLVSVATIPLYVRKVSLP